MTIEPEPKFLACALCDPATSRPASVVCTNHCGRFVCAAHAHSILDDGSGPLVCEACWEQRGVAQPIPESEIPELLREKKLNDLARPSYQPQFVVEGDLTSAPPANRTFLLIALVLLGLIFMTVSAMALYVFFVSARGLPLP